jgi:DNA primase
MGLEIKDLDLTQKDIRITPKDIIERTQLVLDAHKNLSGDELKYLKDRGFTDELIDIGKFGSMSYIKDQVDLDILGISTHPIMNNMFDGGTKGGGIIIPLINKKGDLINCTFRKISDYNKLKYTHSCPDLYVWGVEDIQKGDIVWLVEGVFDKYVLDLVLPEGSKVVATSSASISPVQYMKIINKKPSKVNIICDNDQVGFRTGGIAQKIFHLNRIICSTFYFDESKDVADHFLLNNGDIFDLIKIDITKEFIEEQGTEYEDRIPLNFFDYLHNRKF